MTSLPQSPPPAPDEPVPDELAWAGRPVGDGFRPAWAGTGRQLFPLILAGLGAIAIVGSLIGDWQILVLDRSSQLAFDQSQRILRVTDLVWGFAWLILAPMVVTVAAMGLLGPAVARPVARAVGIAFAGAVVVQLGVAASFLQQEAPGERQFGPIDVEVAAGWGVFAGIGGVALIGLALVLARPAPAGDDSDRDRSATGDPATGDEDGDAGPYGLRVGSADTLQG